MQDEDKTEYKSVVIIINDISEKIRNTRYK